VQQVEASVKPEPEIGALIRVTHVVIHAMQSDHLVMRNMHHAQQ
jgi:hypothetical protein